MGIKLSFIDKMVSRAGGKTPFKDEKHLTFIVIVVYRIVSGPNCKSTEISSWQR